MFCACLRKQTFADYRFKKKMCQDISFSWKLFTTNCNCKLFRIREQISIRKREESNHCKNQTTHLDKNEKNAPKRRTNIDKEN